MLVECFNPACRKELRYLRGGRVVRVLKEGIDRIEVEHFWLCGACYVSYDFRFGEGGRPTLTTKSSSQIASDLAIWLDNVTGSEEVQTAPLSQIRLLKPTDDSTPLCNKEQPF
jgi:hypothetical protein